MLKNASSFNVKRDELCCEMVTGLGFHLSRTELPSVFYICIIFPFRLSLSNE